VLIKLDRFVTGYWSKILWDMDKPCDFS